jgi:hypothetical protein
MLCVIRISVSGGNTIQKSLFLKLLTPAAKYQIVGIKIMKNVIVFFYSSHNGPQMGD